MVGCVALSAIQRVGSGGIGSSVSVMESLVPLPRLISQPEVIGDQQPDEEERNAANLQPHSAYFSAALLGLLCCPLGTTRGVFG